MRDMYSNIAASLLILRGREVLLSSGSAVADLAGYDAATILIGVGGSGTTLAAASNVRIFIYHGNDSTGAATGAVVTADLIGATSTSGRVMNLTSPTVAQAAAGITRVGYIGGKRYVRVKYFASGSATGAAATGAASVQLCVSVVKGRPALAPVS